MRFKCFLAMFSLAALLYLSPAIAQTFPCAFFGTVMVDGNPANASLVTAHLNSTGAYIATAKQPLAAGFGNYTITLTVPGEYVKFKIAGVWVNEPEQLCTSGDSKFLNLTTSCVDCDNDGYNYTVDCDDSNPEIHPDASEICNNIDDDCDNIVDNFTDYCYTGPPNTLGVGICRAGVHTCMNGVWSECSGQVLPQTEDCNGLDDDCDGYVDDGVCGSPTTTTTLPTGGGGGGGGAAQTTTTTTTTLVPSPETTTTTVPQPEETTTTTIPTTTTTQPGGGMPTSLFILMQENPIATAGGLILVILVAVAYFARSSISKFIKKYF